MPRSWTPDHPLAPSQLDRPSTRLRNEEDPPSEPRALKEPAADRAHALLSTLDRATGLVERTCRATSPFAALSLELLEKAVRDLDTVVQLVERSQLVGGGADHAADVLRATEPLVRDGALPQARPIDPEPDGEFDRRSQRTTIPIDLYGRGNAQDGTHGFEDRTAYKSSDRHSKEPNSRDVEDRRMARGEQLEPQGRTRRDPAPPRANASSRRSYSRPASPEHVTPSCPPIDAPTITSRSASRAASHVFSHPLPSAPPADEDDAGPFSRRHGERTRSHAPPVGIPPPTARDDSFGRPKSRASTASSRRAATAVTDALHRPSSRSRFAADSSDEDDADFRTSRRHADGEVAGRDRARSIGRPAARSHSGRSDDARRALDMASAPPDEESAHAFSRPPPSLGELKVAKAIAVAAAGLGTDGTTTLLALALVSKTYHVATVEVLYRTITVDTKRRLELLNRTLGADRSRGELVHSLNVRPLDAHLPHPSPEALIPPLKTLLDHLPNLATLDEDFTTGEWDVRELTSGRDYPLTVSSPAKLARFRSAKNWWEISALHSLLQSQPGIVELVLGGAAMDRDWAGSKLLAVSPGVPPPARRLESLEISQVMHEDTLAVLLRATGGSAGRLTSLRIGFQSIGGTDDDTPRASIPAALATVGPTLTHLALTAPTKASDDTTGLVDEIVAVLPRLEVLEWSEGTELAPVPLATSKLLAQLPPSLRVLRARALVSISTSSVLNLLYKPGAVPALRAVDVQWAHGTSVDDGKEPWYKERHIARIEDAAAELGVECSVGKGDDALVFRRA